MMLFMQGRGKDLIQCACWLMAQENTGEAQRGIALFKAAIKNLPPTQLPEHEEALR